MKLLIENWRRYQGEHDFNVLCENHTRGLITDTELVMLWENQVNNELDLLISEGIMDTLAIGYEKGKQLVGTAADKWNAAIEKWADWEANLLNQIWALIEKVKQTSVLSQIGAALKKVSANINKYCSVHPKLCKMTNSLLMIMAVTSVIAFFSSNAEAAVQVKNFAGESIVLNDDGINAIKGAMEMASDGANPEQQQMFVDAYKWIEAAHASETVHDLAISSEKGAQICNHWWEAAKAMAKGPDKIPGVSLDTFVNIGEKVIVKTQSFTREVYATGKGTQVTHIEWQSLTTPK